MRGLAYRRQKVKLKKHKVKNYRHTICQLDSPKLVGIYATSPKTCSCHMCGNPRKYWKEDTFQEKRENCKLRVDKSNQIC